MTLEWCIIFWMSALTVISITGLFKAANVSVELAETQHNTQVKLQEIVHQSRERFSTVEDNIRHIRIDDKNYKFPFIEKDIYQLQFEQSKTNEVLKELSKPGKKK